MAPSPPSEALDFGLAVREAAGTQERAVVKGLEESGKRRLDSVRDEGDTGRKRRAESVGAEADTSNKRRAYSIRAEPETCDKRSCGSRLCADTYGLLNGKPTGDWEGTFYSEGDLAAGTSAGHQKSFDKECVSPDAAQKAKNHMETLEFLAEMEEQYSLDAYRQRFALNNGLPLPPPSWERLPTPPLPSSPPPRIIQISNYDEGKSAIRTWTKGCHVHLQVSPQLSLVNAEQISNLVMVVQAEQAILNLSVLEAKVSQAKFLRKTISHAEDEIQRCNKMLDLPWMPTQTVLDCNLL